MSTDLHLHHDLPKLRISPIKMENHNNNNNNNDDSITPISSLDTDDKNDTAASVVSRAGDQNADQLVPLNDRAVSVDDDDDDEESYRTPTSKESKIPAVLTCPPAPKKAKAFVSCKRKLLEDFQFFEVSNKEDMDAFFRSTFPKRTCPCT